MWQSHSERKPWWSAGGNAVTRFLTKERGAKEEQKFSARKVLISWRLLSARARSSPSSALLQWSVCTPQRMYRMQCTDVRSSARPLLYQPYIAYCLHANSALYTITRKKFFYAKYSLLEYKIKVQKQCQRCNRSDRLIILAFYPVHRLLSESAAIRRLSPTESYR